MAYITGTATDKGDLWDKLVAFLTTNADLVTASQAWDIVWTDPSADQKKGIVLKGSGAAGLDSIFLGLSRLDSDVDDQNRIYIRGMQGIISAAPTIDDHLNCSGKTGIMLDAHPMTYWMVANGRRFMVVVKMSTVYEAMYGGFMLPYANPLVYPYPLIVGGSWPDWTGTGTIDSWRSQSTLHHHFAMSELNNNDGNGNPKVKASMYLIDPSGAWLNCSGQSPGADLSVAPLVFKPQDEVNVADWGISAANTVNGDRSVMGYDTMLQYQEENVGGGYALDPFTLIQTLPTIQTYGILDGAYHVPGQSNAVENTIEIDGTDYLVVQDVFRTEVDCYWAMRLD